jgi:hypothetical protein
LEEGGGHGRPHTDFAAVEPYVVVLSAFDPAESPAT